MRDTGTGPWDTMNTDGTDCPICPHCGHSFSHDFLQLSTDYKLLWELVQSGKRVPAWLVYNDKYEKPIWDLVEVKNIWGEPNDYSIGTRGIGYEGAKTFKWFEAICQKYSLHFVCPQNCG